jgi:3beta-hydroxy-Delta5-steroid dehydrogenase / steroid Delta-isomerase
MADNASIRPARAFLVDDIGSRCLVTGGAGYLGTALVRRLHSLGCTVRSLDVLPHKHGAGVEVVTGDLRDYPTVRAACEGVDTVFHTAALMTILSLYRRVERERVFGVNVTGAENIIRAAQETGVSALVQTSSFNVMLDGPAVPSDETAPYVARPKDLYSLSKIEAERCVLGADQRGGLRTCALRPGGIWGTDCGSLMMRSFLETLAAGSFKALVGPRTATMDNTHVENLVDAQLLAAHALHKRPDVAGGQAYFITDGEPMNGMEWFRPLVEGLDYPFPTTWVPGGVMKSIAWLLEFAHLLGTPVPTITVRGIRNLTEGSWLKIDKARQDLGYVPRHTRANTMPLVLPEAREFVAARARA